MDVTTAPLYGLAAIGLLIALKYAENTLSYIYCHFLRPSKNIKKRYGSWTVVTGATDGIGKAMAFELAKRGLNVVLISRSKDKLIECAAELTAKYPKVEVKILDVDFSDFSAAVRTRVTSFLEGLDVGVLVNNVGISYPFTKFFHELDDDRVEQLITLNVNSTTWMSRYSNSTIPFRCYSVSFMDTRQITIGTFLGYHKESCHISTIPLFFICHYRNKLLGETEIDYISRLLQKTSYNYLPPLLTALLLSIFHRIVLSGMISRKRGAIVNIGSAAGVSSSPLLAQYGAAKSYIAMFSKGTCCKRMFFTALLF